MLIKFKPPVMKSYLYNTITFKFDKMFKRVLEFLVLKKYLI